MIRRLMALSWVVALTLFPGAAMAADSRADTVYGAHVPDAAAPAGGIGPFAAIGILALAGAGAWLFLKGRKIQLPGRAPRKLQIDETRSLGSRQYLVVASYEGRKMLLGVCPGKIDLLTHLDGAPKSE